MDLEDQAWEAYTNRDVAAALSLFSQAMQEDPGDPDVYFGFLRSLIMAGRLKEAEEHMPRFARLEPDGLDLNMVRAELLGASGHRAKASQLLGQALLLEPDEPLALALMGEQRLRLGDWDGGVEYFSKALRSPDREGFALHHFQGVAQALCQAVGQNAVPLKEATAFFNRLSYATPQALSWLWKPILSALKSGRPISYGAGRGAKTMASSPREQLYEPKTTSVPDARAKRQVKESSKSKAPALARVKSAFIASLREQRVQNQVLQQEIGPMPVVSWPSEQAFRLDQIKLELRPLNRAALGMGRRDAFHVTGGSIFTELYLDRCKEAMLAILPDEELSPMLYTPGGVIRLELNLREHLPEELEVMREDLKVSDLITSDALTAAVGSFLGQVVCAEHEGVWRFDANPERSSVHVGGTEVFPLQFAAQWLAQVRAGGTTSMLEDFLESTRHESGADGGMVRAMFIDPTKEVVDRALLLALANQWGMYRLSLLRTSSAQIAADMEVTMESEAATLVQIHTKWLPKQVIAPDSLWEEHASLLYVRETGAWLPLWHKGVAERAMGIVSPHASAEDTKGLIKVAAQGYKHHARVMDSKAALGEMPARLREQMKVPSWSEKGGERRLEFWSIDQGGKPVRWELLYRSGERKKWEIV